HHPDLSGYAHHHCARSPGWPGPPEDSPPPVPAAGASHPTPAQYREPVSPPRPALAADRPPETTLRETAAPQTPPPEARGHHHPRRTVIRRSPVPSPPARAPDNRDS